MSTVISRIWQGKIDFPTGIELKCEHENESTSCAKGFIVDVAKVLREVNPDYIGRGKEDGVEKAGVVSGTRLICLAITTKAEDLFNLDRHINSRWSRRMKGEIAQSKFLHRKILDKTLPWEPWGPTQARIDLWLM